MSNFKVGNKVHFFKGGDKPEHHGVVLSIDPITGFVLVKWNKSKGGEQPPYKHGVNPKSLKLV